MRLWLHLKGLIWTFSFKNHADKSNICAIQGLLKNGTIAVKKLKNVIMDDTNFNTEVCNMAMVKHKNIVRFLGYCGDTQTEVHNYEGKNVIVEERQRLLCFEYLPEGSLRKHIYGIFLSIVYFNS